MTTKILAVDDHPQTLDIIIITLQQRGFLAIGCNAPQEAVSMAEREQPDLILLDMNMPGMDGKEVCRRLRAHKDFAKTPIIMFSAEAAEKLASFEAGADDFLVKPTDPDQLIARIEALLARVGQRATGDGQQSGQPRIAEVSQGEGEVLPANLGQSDAVGAGPTESEPGLEKRTIAFLGVRGGSGTTTVAANVAWCAAKMGRATTLVDLDLLQGHVGMFFNMKAMGGLNVLSVLQDSQLRQRLPGLLVRYNENLNLLLCKPNLLGGHRKPSPAQMAIIINAIMQRSRCMVVDLGREITNVTRTVLETADEVVVCFRPERVSLSIARGLLAQLSQMLYEHTSLRALMVAAVGGMNLPRKAVEQFLGHPLLAVIPAQPKEMIHAMNKGVPFAELYPQANVTKLFGLLAQALATEREDTPRTEATRSTTTRSMQGRGRG